MQRFTQWVIVLLLLAMSGPVVAQDDLAAVRKAAEQGDAMAQNNLGVLYATGQGVPRNHEKSLHWYRMAAQQGHAIAQYNLGGLYYQGQGVPRDEREAAKWYRISAQQGYAAAQYNLGRMYAVGEGVSRDLAQAHHWLDLAAAQGDGDAMHDRDLVAKQMPPPVVAQAQKVTRDEKPVQQEKPVLREEKPVVQEEKPVMQEEKPVLQEEKPVVREEKPVVSEEKPVMQEEKPERELRKTEVAPLRVVASPSQAEPPAQADAPSQPLPPAEEIEQTVQAWAKAWASRNVEEYLSFYSSNSFVPTKHPNWDAWKSHRQNTIQSARTIRVSLSAIQVKMMDATHAQCSFVQDFSSNTLQVKSNKVLTLQKEEGGWKIVREHN
ncbi:MAG: SEL1-like repeat protein [Magnetococcales bacterium]|nr:SEL1-like repeat protein [Magnetococcales bacterium]